MDYKKTASHKQMLKNNALMLKIDSEREKNRIKNLNSVRSRPKQHSRSGSVTVKGYRSPTTVNAGLAINQVGAKALTHRNHTYYELGGGLFTKKQILESRRRIGEVKYNIKTKKKDVGL